MNPRNYVLLACAALGAFVLWNLRRSPTHQTPISSTLIVGTNAEYPPFTFIKQDELVGFDIDIAREVAQRLNKTIEFKDMAFTNLIPELQYGHIDVVAAGLTPTPERSKRVAFTKPYLTGDPLVIITRGQATPVTMLDELQGKDVVVNEGYNADTYMTAWGKANITRLISPADGFMAVKTGRAHAFVAAKSSVQPFFDLHGHAEFSVTPLPDTGDSYALAVALKNTALKNDIQKALDAMQAEGLIEQLRKKWGL